MEQAPAGYRYFQADLSNPQEAARLVQEAGPVDILVNNAGVGSVTGFLETTAEQWEQTLAVNLSSVFYASQAALPSMLERGWGRIINIGSVHSLVAAPNKAAYVASKFGLLGLTKSIALEVASRGVTVNLICPGYVRTPLIEGRIAAESARLGMSPEDWITQVLLKNQPTGKLVAPEEIAGTVAFLCSSAADSMTGHEIVLDGGWSAA